MQWLCVGLPWLWEGSGKTQGKSATAHRGSGLRTGMALCVPRFVLYNLAVLQVNMEMPRLSFKL